MEFYNYGIDKILLYVCNHMYNTTSNDLGTANNVYLGLSP